MERDISYYQGLLTSEYQNKPNITAWLTALLTPLFDATGTINSFLSAFDIDIATGYQLDILGTILGQSRNMTFQPSGGISPVLDDDTYRLLLRATIIKNQWDGTQGSLETAWANLFPGGKIVIIDNQNMTADVTLVGSFSSIIVDLITNGLIVPRPQTVLYNYILGTEPFFGFDRSDAYIAGFDTGNWA